MALASTSSVQPVLWQKALWTIGALGVYAIGEHVPLPGVDVSALNGSGLRIGVERLSIFAIGLTPIFSILLILELGKSLVPAFGRWANANATRLRLFVVLAALAMAAFQAVGIAHGLEGIRGLVDEPGPMFRAVIAITLVGATAFLAWLSERVTVSGLGKGFWILLIAPILLGAPMLAAGSFELLRQGAIGPEPLVAALAFFAGAFVLLALFASGKDSADAQGATPIDVWPAILANYAAGPLMLGIAWLAGADAQTTTRVLEVGHPLRLFFLALLILAFTILRSSFVARGRMWTYACLQIVICAVGELLTRWTEIPFVISGPWTIVIVAVILDIVADLRAASATDELPAPTV